MKKRFNIQAQFFVSYLSIAFLVVFVFSFFFYHYTSDILIEREMASFQTTASTLLEQTDREIETMDNVSVNLTYSNLVKNRVTDYFNMEHSTKYDFSALVELFVAVNGSDYQVNEMKLYSNNGQVISVGTTTKSSKVKLEELEWIDETKRLNGYKNISMPYSTSSMSRTSTVAPYYISLYRSLIGRSGKQLGYVETIQPCKKIFNHIGFFQRTSESAASIYVFNKDGSLIYPYDASTKKDNSLYEYYYKLTKQSNNPDLTLSNPETKEKELITYKYSNYTDWTYVCVQAESAILAPVKSFANILLVIILIVFMLVVFLSYMMAKKLTSPIHQLVHTIHKTKLETLGSLNKDTLDTNFNEFDELNDAFHQMRTDLKTSMDELIETRQQEIKSRSLALQSQMNPHFYFNSLSSIMILAENGKSDDVVELCKNLSTIMRYITKGTALVVSLGEEIEYISKYLYCMKVRYQSSLNYSIDIAPDLKEILIPKLIIQPLVENALKYGTNCDPPWTITISSTSTEDYWRIDVIDSGNGFTKEALALMEERIKNADASIGMPDVQIDGMGLINVYSRWKLYCGEGYIFNYGNHENGGGFVSIGKYFDHV